MLKIIVLGDEFFNEEDSTFETIGDVELELEHSLVSLSKWESIHQKPFLDNIEKTPEEILDYIKCMILTEDFPQEAIGNLTKENMSEVAAYIESSQSATTFGTMPEPRGRGETVTSELIYYWMVAFTIPFECELWHLNRLFALIKICNIKNAPAKKMSRSEVAHRNRELNAARRARYNTKG